MMETGSIVWFSSDPQPYVVEGQYCRNPGCQCHEIQLIFTRIEDPQGLASQRASFRIRVDLDTWQERDPPPRQPQQENWVQEFLSEFPDSRKAEFRAHYNEGKQIARRLNEYVLDPRAVLTGELISYTDVLTGGQSLSSGGRSYSHRFTYRGREYLVDDLYCPNPDCDCQAVQVEFSERTAARRIEENIISVSFLGRVTFDGRLEIERTGKRKRAESLRILTDWWKEHQCDLSMFQERYGRIKEIGRRSVDARIKKSRHMAAVSRPKELDRPAQPDPRGFSPNVARRIGRNDPCPCGSGKKFKHCCATRTHNSQRSPK